MKSGLQRLCALILIIVSGLWSQQISAEGFVTGTLVKVPDGYVPIETLKVGDVVCCLGAENRLTQSLVTAKTTHKGSSQVELKINNTLLLLSPTQKFSAYKPHELLSEWLVASELTQNNSLVALNKRASLEDLPIVGGLFFEYPIQECCVVADDEPQMFHTISVASFKNYCVTESDIVVHNYSITIPITIIFDSAGAEFIVPSGAYFGALLAAVVLLEVIEHAYPGSTSGFNADVSDAGMRKISGEGSERGEWWESNVDKNGKKIEVRSERIKRESREALESCERHFQLLYPLLELPKLADWILNESEETQKSEEKQKSLFPQPPPQPEKEPEALSFTQGLGTKALQVVGKIWNALTGKQPPKDPPGDGGCVFGGADGLFNQEPVSVSDIDFNEVRKDPLGYMYEQQQEENRKNYEAGRNDPLGLNKQLEENKHCVAEFSKEQPAFLEEFNNLIQQKLSEENNQFQGTASSYGQAGLQKVFVERVQKAPVLDVNKGDDSCIKNSTQDSGKQDTPQNTNNDNDDDNNPPGGGDGGGIQECLELFKKSPEEAQQWLCERGLNSPEDIVNYLKKHYPRDESVNEGNPLSLTHGFPDLGEWGSRRQESSGAAFSRYLDKTTELMRGNAVRLCCSIPILVALAVLSSNHVGAQYVATFLAVQMDSNREEIREKIALLNYQLHHDRPEFLAEMTALAADVGLIYTGGKVVGGSVLSAAEKGSLTELELVTNNTKPALPIAPLRKVVIDINPASIVVEHIAEEVTAQEIGAVSRTLLSAPPTQLVVQGVVPAIIEESATKMALAPAISVLHNAESSLIAAAAATTLTGITLPATVPVEPTPEITTVTNVPTQASIITAVSELPATKLVPSSTPALVPSSTPALVPSSTPALVPSSTPALVPSSTPALYVSPVSSTQQVPTSISQATPVSFSTLPNASVQAVPSVPGGQATTLVPAVNTKPSSPAPNRQPPAPPAGSPSGPPLGSPSGHQSPAGNVQQRVPPQGKTQKPLNYVNTSLPIPAAGDIPALMAFLAEEWIVGGPETILAAQSNGALNYSSRVAATEIEIELFYQEFFVVAAAQYGPMEPSFDRDNPNLQNGWKFVQIVEDPADKAFEFTTMYEYRWPAVKGNGIKMANFTKKITRDFKIKNLTKKSEQRISTQNFHIIVK